MSMKVARTWTISPTGALAVAFLAPAAAQQTADTAPVAGKETVAVAVSNESIVARGWRVSQFLHSVVFNDQGEKIGKVDDIIIAPDGSLSIAVIDVGGFLGIAQHRVAIPLGRLPHLEPGRVVLPGATKESLKSLPEFTFES